MTPHPVTWTVIAVFDPAASQPGFAYTNGVVAAGGPAELHLWAQPDHSDDLAEDWTLSTRDRQHLLNDLAIRLLDGELHIGDRWTDTLDAGYTTLTWNVGEPVTASHVGAYQLDETTPVWPLHWTLHRQTPTPGEPLPLPSPDDVAAQTATFRAASGVRCDIWGEEPVIVTADANHGPWAPVIAELRCCAASGTPVILDLAMAGLAIADRLPYQLGIIQAAARACGRSNELAAASGTARLDAQQIVEHAGITDDDPEFAKALIEHVRLVLTVAYGAWVIADTLSDDVFEPATALIGLYADPASASVTFASAWAAVGRPTPPVTDVPVTTDDPDDADHDMWCAHVQSAAAGSGAPLVRELVPGWETVEQGGPRAVASTVRAVVALRTT